MAHEHVAHDQEDGSVASDSRYTRLMQLQMRSNVKLHTLVFNDAPKHTSVSHRT